ncbi:MAG: 30S ribosomal protein S17 [Candidatus Omnitrophota bacterium]
MGARRQYTGEVVSDKMQKTRVVKVTRIAKHPKYNRVSKQFNKFKVHDEENASKLGDIVRIEETRPISKDKRYRLVEITKKSQTAHISVKEE